MRGYFLFDQNGGFFGEHGQELQHFFLQFLAGLELDHCPGGNGHITVRVVRIPADLGFGHPDFESSEIPQHHLGIPRQMGGHVVQEKLQDVKYLILGQCRSGR